MRFKQVRDRLLSRRSRIKEPTSPLERIRFALVSGEFWDDGRGPITDPKKKNRIKPADLVALDCTLTEVTDANLARLGLHHMARLEVVHLNGTKITDATFQALANAKHLHTLGLSRTAITDAGLGDLVKHKSITKLELADTAITDAGLKQLRQLPYLTELDLAGTKITDAGLGDLASLVNLTRLDLSRCELTDQGLADLLPRLKMLAWLGIDRTEVGPKDLASFQALATSSADISRLVRRLRHLQWRTNEIIDANLVDHLLDDSVRINLRPGIVGGSRRFSATIDEVKVLSLHGVQITDASLKEFKVFKNLELLDLSWTQVAGADLNSLWELDRLSSLNLSLTPITDAACQQIAGFRHLTDLDLSWSALTDDCLGHLRAVEKLSRLSLSHTRVTDNGMPTLAGFKTLTALDLENVILSDSGVKALVALENLTELRIQVTDSGLQTLRDCRT